MRTERLVIGAVTATLSAFALCYAIWRDAAVGTVDWAGVTVLGMGAILCAAMELSLPTLPGMIEPRSGTRHHQERTDALSDLSRRRYWTIAVATTATALGLVHQALWIIAPGVAAVVLTTGGLLFRHPSRPRVP